MRELHGLVDHLASCGNTADSARTLTAFDGQQTEPRLALTVSNPYFMKPCYPRLSRQSLQLCGSAQSVGAGGNCVRMMDVPWIYMMSSADTDSASSWVMLGQFHFFTASSRTKLSKPSLIVHVFRHIPQNPSACVSTTFDGAEGLRSRFRGSQGPRGEASRHRTVLVKRKHDEFSRVVNAVARFRDGTGCRVSCYPQ